MILHENGIVEQKAFASCSVEDLRTAAASLKDVPLDQMEKLTEALLDSLGSARLVS